MRITLQQHAMYEIEMNLRGAREAAGHIKKGFYHHATVKKYASAFILEVIEAVEALKQSLAAADSEHENIEMRSYEAGRRKRRHNRTLRLIGFLVRAIEGETEQWLLSLEGQVKIRLESYSQRNGEKEPSPDDFGII